MLTKTWNHLALKNKKHSEPALRLPSPRLSSLQVYQSRCSVTLRTCRPKNELCVKLSLENQFPNFFGAVSYIKMNHFSSSFEKPFSLRYGHSGINMHSWFYVCCFWMTLSLDSPRFLQKSTPLFWPNHIISPPQVKQEKIPFSATF